MPALPLRSHARRQWRSSAASRESPGPRAAPGAIALRSSDRPEFLVSSVSDRLRVVGQQAIYFLRYSRRLKGENRASSRRNAFMAEGCAGACKIHHFRDRGFYYVVSAIRGSWRTGPQRAKLRHRCSV